MRCHRSVVQAGEAALPACHITAHSPTWATELSLVPQVGECAPVRQIQHRQRGTIAKLNDCVANSSVHVSKCLEGRKPLAMMSIVDAGD